MRKKKRKKLKIGRVILCLLIIGLIVTTLLYKDTILLKIDSYKYGYSEESISVFKKNNIFEDIKKNKYSKTVERVANSKYYNKNYLEDYFNINYRDNEDFIEDINLLLDLDYTSENINNFYDKLSNDSINVIKNSEYDSNIDKYMELDYFNEEYLSRYLNYFKNNSDLDSEKVVTYVNIGLDNDYYTNINDVNNQDDLSVLVNKYNKLSSDYVPNDLKTISSHYSYGTQKMQGIAVEKFEEMCKDIEKTGLKLYATSAYRSYDTQNTLYNNYVYRDGKSEADTYSARPGYSEHQTGLAVDVGGSTNATFYYSDEYDWMIDNSYKYGFILRYPEGKEFITGYMFESWHYRFLGVETATYIHENNLTYEEYMAQK